MSHEVAGAGAHEFAGGAITIDVASGGRLAALQADWQDLSARADAANIFMQPELVRLAGESYPARRCCAVLAWQETGAGGQPRLVGVWAFAIGRAPQSIIKATMLTAPPMPHGYLSTPVIDRDRLDSVLEAMLAHIAADESLPKIVALDAMGVDTATMQALSRVLAARGGAPCIFSQTPRPKLQSDLDGKAYLEKALSSSSRKKLRQHRRRLAGKGALEFRVLTEVEETRRAFEEFLTLEASGWKGRQGTALLSREADAHFARAMIAALAAQSDVSIHMLTLDTRPVSMQIILRAGPAAFTWKTAYDEALHDVSPGMLLLEDYTAALLADEDTAYVDSCAFDDSGYMATWTERATIAQLWFDTRRGHSPAFTILSQLQRAYVTLRGHAKSIYHKNIRRRER